MNILVTMDGRDYKARPEGWDKPGFWEAVKRAFTLKYEVYDWEGRLASKVDYNFSHSYILIRREEGDRQVKLPIFDLHAQRYYLKEKVTGFLIWPLVDGGRIRIVAEGEKSLREYAIDVKCDDESLDTIILEFTIGLMIRWMSFNIGI